MEIYDAVKSIMYARPEAENICNELKQRREISELGILYICRNRKSKEEFIRFIKTNYNKNETIKTIEECKHLEGCKFNKIYFID